MGPHVGNDVRRSHVVPFSELHSEEQSWSDWVTLKRPKVLFGSQTVIVRDGMRTRDDFSFDEVHVVGDSLSKLITRGGDASRPLTMHDNDFNGEIIVKAGALQVDDSRIAAKRITVQNEASLLGNGVAAPDYGPGRQRDQHILIERGGSLQVGSLAARTKYQAESFVIKGNLAVHGDVWIHNLPSGAGSTLYVQGDYHGEKGSVVHMAIDERARLVKLISPSRSMAHDKLVIMGNSSGESQVRIINLGSGADIDYARGVIKLITVRGDSAAEFTLAGRAVAGSYEYRLARRDDRDPASGSRKDWYLVSDTSENKDQSDGSAGDSSSSEGRTSPKQISERPPSDEQSAAADPGNSSDSKPDTTNENALIIRAPLAPRTKVIRPEAGSYNSNALAANTMFQMNLNDRLSSYYQGEAPGHHGSVWVRYNGSRNHLNDASGQLRIRGDKNMAMLGIDMLASSTNLLDQITLGVMGGYGQYHGHTTSRVSGYSSHGKVDGHSVGIYGTYQQNADIQSGIYLDSWVLWNRFNNKVKGDDLPLEKYTSKGVTASAELGYNAKIAERNNVKYVLQPHAQIIYQNVRSANLQEANGTRVHFLNRGRTQTVVGLRAAAHIPSGLTSTITPHLELNWLRSSKNYAVRMNGVGAEMHGGRNTGQLKLGVEGDINQRVSLDVALFRNQGNSGYHETGGNLALKYRY
ncbi:autotransporter outer membrane beta-barrel domain-containing protein [Bordetella muralis]|uniref:autotransporter family protein n=1 Tax=Bordetella muralis TaxID=1649130 RepID=UPI0039EFF341